MYMGLLTAYGWLRKNYPRVLNPVVLLGGVKKMRCFSSKILKKVTMVTAKTPVAYLLNIK